MGKVSVIRYAPDAWKLLSGVFCVYKPAGVHVYQVREKVIGNLVRDLNQLEVRPPKQYAKIEGSLKDGLLTVTDVPSFADRELVLGPRYQPQDFKVGFPTPLGRDTSGVFVMGVNNYSGAIGRIRRGNLVREYEIECTLGICTDNFMDYGKVLEKSTHRHVKCVTMDKVLGSIQATYQISMFDFCGVSVQSQAAYEMASRGVVRPANTSTTIIYGLRCIQFEPPSFTIQMHVINENEDFLKEFVNNLGLRLKSNAVCKKIRQTRYGHFHLDHALLRKHWTLENIINNIRFCEGASSLYATVPRVPFLQQETAEKFIGNEDVLEEEEDIDELNEEDANLFLPEGQKAH